MNGFIFLTLLCCIIGICILIVICNKRNNEIRKIKLEKEKIEGLKRDEIKDYFKEEWDKEEKELDYKRHVRTSEITNTLNQLENKYKLDASKFEGQIKQLDVKLKEKEKRYNEVNQDLDLYRKGKIEEINAGAQEYEQRLRLEASQKAEQHNIALKEASAELQEQLKRSEEVLKNQIEEIKAELEVERSKRAAVNEEIRRAREIEEQQDFYKIQLNSDDANDIVLLRSITPRLRHPEAINKVIWSGYYQKPLAELRKRVAVEAPGVYKITRLKTNEIYIGQAVNVSTRWADHVKSALGVGTLASSQLHRAMAEDGPEQFTFELLEEVPKDKLRERESYYIDFYDSKNYGLNTVKGDQK